jgi:hypothetical protein
MCSAFVEQNGSKSPMKIQAPNDANACEREERLLCGGMSNNFSSRRYLC